MIKYKYYYNKEMITQLDHFNLDSSHIQNLPILNLLNRSGDKTDSWTAHIYYVYVCSICMSCIKRCVCMSYINMQLAFLSCKFKLHNSFSTVHILSQNSNYKTPKGMLNLN